jgi:tetratricopeptide (TPR) repeat protein
MRIKYLFTLLLGASLSMAAQGYKDGIEYYKAGQFDNAITILERNLNDANTDKAMAYYYLGQAYLNQGNKAKAKTCFDNGVKANSSCAYNYVGLGAIDLLNKDNTTAEQNFKKAQGLAKKNTEVIVDIARAYYNADPVAYGKDIEKLIAKAHKDSKDKEPAIYIFEGDRKSDNKDYSGAATEYEQAIYFDEDNPEGYVKYANTYFKVQPAYAIQKLEDLLQRQPNSALAQRELAEKYYENDQWAKAAVQYGEYIENPNHFPQDKARYAVLLYSGNQFQKSYDVATEVLTQDDPDNIVLKRIVIRDLSELNRKEEALAKAEQFFTDKSSASKVNAADYRSYGVLLKELGKDSLALAKFEEGAVAFPKDANLHKEVSDIYFAKRDYVPAAAQYEQYISCQENPSRKNYYDGALRYLGAASVQTDVAKREEYADKGLALMDKAIADLEEVPAPYLRRIALLNIIRNNNKANEKALSIFDKILNMLDKDPANINPSNPNNYLSYYVEAYKYKAQYYSEIQDKTKYDDAKANEAKYQALLDQAK